MNICKAPTTFYLIFAKYFAQIYSFTWYLGPSAKLIKIPLNLQKIFFTVPSAEQL